MSLLMNLQICYLQNRCFVRGFRQFSSHLTKCTPATEFAPCRHLTQPWLTMRFAKNTQHDTSKVLCLPRKKTMDTSKVLGLPQKLQRIFWKTSQKYCACHACHAEKKLQRIFWKRLSTRYKTRLNVAKCHACHAKRSDATCATIGTALRGSCGRLRTVADGWATLSEHTLNPQTPRAGTPCYAFGKRNIKQMGSPKPMDFHSDCVLLELVGFLASASLLRDWARDRSGAASWPLHVASPKLKFYQVERLNTWKLKQTVRKIVRKPKVQCSGKPWLQVEVATDANVLQQSKSSPISVPWVQSQSLTSLNPSWAVCTRSRSVRSSFSSNPVKPSSTEHLSPSYWFYFNYCIHTQQPSETQRYACIIMYTYLKHQLPWQQE